MISVLLVFINSFVLKLNMEEAEVNKNLINAGYTDKAVETHKLLVIARAAIMVIYFFKIVCGDKLPFCGATGALCFGLRLTLLLDFKARVDAPSPVHDVPSL